MALRKTLKSIANKVLPGLTKRYLAKPRRYTYKGTTVTVQPGVFHPGIYFSTKLLIAFLEKQAMQGKALLELGAGSGLISIRMARAGARVTATDISHAAIQNIRANADANNAQLEVIHSDLFTGIALRQFDWIVVNPPYYQGEPENEEQYAWYCGPDFEYFDGLFGHIGPYLSEDGRAILILSEDCNIARIKEIAGLHGKALSILEQKRVMGEWNYLFEIIQG